VEAGKYSAKHWAAKAEDVVDEAYAVVENKVDKTAVKQETGASTTDVMSQKAVTDEIAQLAGKTSQLDKLIMGGDSYLCVIDFITTYFNGSEFQILYVKKSTREVSIRRTSNGTIYNGVGTAVEGKEWITIEYSGTGMPYVILMLVDWSLISTDVIVSETVVIDTVSSFGMELKDMLFSKKYIEKGELTYNDDGVVSGFDIQWADGTSGNVYMTDYDINVLEYRNVVATYKDIEITYGTKTFDELGNVVSITDKTIIKNTQL
jgi:hypothetical protein